MASEHLHDGRFIRADAEGDLVMLHTRQPGENPEVCALSLSYEMGDIKSLLSDLEGVYAMVADWLERERSRRALLAAGRTDAEIEYGVSIGAI